MVEDGVPIAEGGEVTPVEGELLSLLEKEGRLQAGRKKVQLLFTGILVVILLGYLVTVLTMVKSNFSRKKIEQGAREVAPKIMRVAEPEVRTAGMKLKDVYLRASQQQCNEKWDTIHAVIEKEFTKFQLALARQAEALFMNAASDAFHRRVCEVKGVYPELKDEETTGKWVKSTRGKLQADLTAILGEFKGLYAEDVVRIRKTIDEFPRHNGSEDQVEREFLHAWIMLMDHYVMHGELHLPQFSFSVGILAFPFESFNKKPRSGE